MALSTSPAALLLSFWSFVCFKKNNNISFIFMADEWARALYVHWSYYWELRQDLSALPFLFPPSLDAEIALRWLQDFLPLEAPRVKARSDLSIRTRRGVTGDQAQRPFGGIRACLEPALHRPWFINALSRQSWNGSLKMKGLILRKARVEIYCSHVIVWAFWALYAWFNTLRLIIRFCLTRYWALSSRY